ncbi:MAG: DUF547 domain-containing protein [Saprospiraceae bacterium]|nr:DUF547 domain-containing protein [Saprospiraceae bacterium]
MNANQLSEQLLLAAKTGQDYFRSMARLELLLPSQLQTDLADDAHKLAFWINIYNAQFLILKKELGLRKPRIFTKKEIKIAGMPFSLDDIEHGILRRSRIKWSFGYLPNPFSTYKLRRLMIARTDPRIHFALNCGAKSCPPIGVYSSEKIEQQLALATASFLEQETSICNQKREIRTTSLLCWYLGDFGGVLGIRRLLSEVLDVDQPTFRLIFNEYDWSES